MRDHVAGRYAKALFDLALEHHVLEQAEADVRTLGEVLHATPELASVLDNPSISAEELKQVLQTSFTGFNSIVLNTLLVMVENDRAAEIVTLPEHFIALLNEHRNVATAIVTSAYKLSGEELTKVKETFGQKSGKTLEVENVVDTSVIGGLRVQIGYTTYDGTIETKLTRLERELLKA
ncbi:F0F1 ATP synthase subunit delta [Exiguobacterium sp. s130]|uniref:F0F1 ATP synthase subunit delta n=1 Tax=Exiguobacterium sp. s130 TaxID=2751190 RepID=UPI001BE9FC77|nr:F0F1 ATP synthase subunit delta [Exiguobacterium sp. s130]